MNRVLIKDSLKEIKNTYKRFISILLMAFLGVGFFAGLKAASPDMVDTIDYYYDSQNVYDIQVVSTLGLTEDDIKAIAEIENVEKVIGNYETDGKIEIENKELVAKFITLEELNQPILKEGNLPQSENECLVEESFLSANNKKIGDTIQVEIEDSTQDDGEKINYLKQKELKIVGIVQSPLYISNDRGTSKLGAGKVNYYIYIPKLNINATDIYTNIYIKVKDAENYTTSTEEYEEYIEEVKDNIEEIKQQREEARHNQLVGIAEEKVNDAEKELNTKKEDGEEEIENAEKEIESSKKKINSAESEISSNEKKADSELKKAESAIAKEEKKLEENEKTLEEKETEANKQFEELESKKKGLQENLEEVNEGIQQLEEQYTNIIKLLEDEDLEEEQKQSYEEQKVVLEEELKELKSNKESIEAGIEEIETGIKTGKEELESAKKQLEEGKTTLSQEKAKLKETKQQTYNEIEQAKKELEEAKEELKSGEEELSKSKKEFEEKIEDAEKELQEAKDKILEIENPTWYILDRNANAGYVSFIQDTESIASIAKVFPVVFFIVAALISLTSMTRMVEEQRMQIGTLKALGYNKWQIMSKYIIYAGLACIIGSILGMCVGFVLLPKIIWMLYGMMYELIDIIISFNVKYALIGLILICICIIGATIYTALKELINTPSVLMRPKTPKMGNRVLLEKIPFIWKRLNFSHKVTVRNLFRYKKRFYMTIIGILGCTALILTGFGVKDSVLKIIPNQFENVFTYDMQINLKDTLESKEKEKFAEELQQKEQIEKVAKVYMTSGTAIKEENSEDVQIIVPEDETTLEGMINIKDLEKKEKIKLTDNEICLTDKAAQLLEVEAGDTIIIKDSDDKEIEIKISNIVENYVQHYIFMNKQTYENIYEEKYNTNVLLTKNIELTEEQQDELLTELMSQKEVSSVTNIETIMKTLKDMMSLLNYVVVILIISAGLLAFVVLYNLANVNISERIRELATIKVLGFYDKEVYEYVTRETVILTIIGILLGLVGGYFLNYYLIGTCEINMLRFSKIVEPISYVYATVITIVFSVIVNVVTYFSLKKINMIESLKSVE